MRPDPKADLTRRLLAFYDAGRRDLPWRRAPDPYRVWVSEVMLQQTRVDSVIPYYEHWLRCFPTLDALAAADLDDVLRAWEGLGYYARARHLHRAARVIRERHRGQLPAEPGELKRLPGIGDYTAGAIASIAYGVPAPAVDGNVRRVLARLCDIERPSPAALRERVAALIPGDRPGDFNQALMELGATVCTPRAPACTTCPVADSCLARARGTQELRPRRRAAKPLPEDAVGTAVVVSYDRRVLLVRRPEDGLLGRLWEFPSAAVRPDETPAAAAGRVACRLLMAHSAAGQALDPVVHTFSHRRTTYHPFRFQVTGDELAVALDDRASRARAASTVVWTAASDLHAFALPVAQRRIAALALAPHPSS